MVNRLRARAVSTERCVRLTRFLNCLLVMASLLTLRASALANESPQPSLMRVRIAWRATEPTLWRGRLSLSGGHFARVRNLSTDENSPGSVLVDGGNLSVHRPDTCLGGEVEVDLFASMQDTLRIDFNGNGNSKELEPVELPLAELARQPQSFQLDDQGRSIQIERSPGDQLRLAGNRSHFIFSPGESWNATIQPHLTPLQPGRRLRLEAELRAGNAGRPVWKNSQEIRFSEDQQSIEPIELVLSLPKTAGVYELDLRIATPLLRNPFSGKAEPVSRTIQLVVMGSQPIDSPQVSAWRSLLEFDPTQDRWWERLKLLPTRNPLSSSSSAEMGNRRTGQVTRAGRRLTRIDPTGWQAYTLPVERVGRPHLLEVEYPVDVAQTLAVSVVQSTDKLGKNDLGPDTCIRVDDVPVPEGGMRWLRMIYWPETKNPYVVMANQGDSPAAFGRVRISAGLKELPSAAKPKRDDGRRILALVDTPFFAETFSALRRTDPKRDGSVEDWNTYYTGADRLAQFLQHAGYAGAVVSVYEEGGSLFPSEQLDASLKYDRGRLSFDSWDPNQKDVLELLFRRFDQDQQVLIPSLAFSAPLPSLERQLRANEGGDGITLRQSTGGTTGGESVRPTRYNPLNERVQQSVREAIAQLSARYQHHPSFGGIALRLEGKSFLHFHDEQDGLEDPHVVDMFLASLPEGQRPARMDDPAEWLATPLCEAWLRWRAGHMSDFYASLVHQVVGTSPHARLLLTVSDVGTDSLIHEATRPTLSRRRDAVDPIVRMGVDVGRFTDLDKLLVLRPYHYGGSAARAAALNTDLSLEQVFADSNFRGAIHTHRMTPFELDQRSEQVSFRLPHGKTQLNPLQLPAGVVNRRRFTHALATYDPDLLVDGGNNLPLGQFDTLIRFNETFSHLPAGRFKTVALAEPGADPVIVRILRRDGVTNCYLVNDSPWSVRFQAKLKTRADCQLESVCESCPVGSWEKEGELASWTCEMEPYSIVAAQLTDDTAEFVEAVSEVPASVFSSLRDRLTAVASRTATLGDPPALDVMANPGFEVFALSGESPGWEFSGDVDQRSGVDTQAYFAGRASLRLSHHTQPVRVLSDRFPAPSTGRLSLQARMKCNSTTPLPVDLWLQGELNGQPFARRQQVQLVAGREGDSSSWSLYPFHVDDLPTDATGHLRVGFELGQPGEVWIDEVHVYDIWFTRAEQNELSKILALADLQLRDGKPGDCQRTLQRYWPNFILQHVPVQRPRIARVSADISPPPTASPTDTPPDGSDDDPPGESGMLNRMRQFIPKLWR